jgi:KDO2-lipid IV(A) lauroyltransferase
MWLIARLPLRLIAVLGAVLGDLMYLLHAPRRRIARRNLKLCFPELSVREYRRLTRLHFRVLGQSTLDMGIAWWASPRRLRRLVRLVGTEHVERARAAGQPVILLVPHFIGIEIAGVRLSLDYPMVDLFHHPSNAVFRGLVERARGRFGLELFEFRRPPAKLIRRVRDGALFYYLPDQDAGRPGKKPSLFVPFFGITAATFNTLGRYAAITKAVVIPCVALQRARGRGYEVVFHPPLTDFPSTDEFADTARMNVEIEQLIRQQPEQYFWVHKRFKTRPKGEPDFYKQK